MLNLIDCGMYLFPRIGKKLKQKSLSPQAPGGYHKTLYIRALEFLPVMNI